MDVGTVYIVCHFRLDQMCDAARPDRQTLRSVGARQVFRSTASVDKEFLILAKIKFGGGACIV